ncbi:MAG: L-threonylcarbamoyladenylate synthase, partial [Candidatus Micrarchaeota archaeon]
MVAKIVTNEDTNSISEAAYVLSRAGVVIAPTETCYALLCDATNHNAVEKIFRIKGREASKSLSVFVSSPRMLDKYAVMNESAKIVAKKNIPGPLTLVLKKRKPFKLAENLSGSDTIAIRISSNLVIRKLLRSYPHPLTATSANVSGEGEIYSAREAIRIFGHLVDLIIDAGNLPKEPPSTVVD